MARGESALSTVVPASLVTVLHAHSPQPGSNVQPAFLGEGTYHRKKSILVNLIRQVNAFFTGWVVWSVCAYVVFRIIIGKHR